MNSRETKHNPSSSLRHFALVAALIVAATVACYAIGAPLMQDRRQRQQRQQPVVSTNADPQKAGDADLKDTIAITAQPLLDDEEEIPDSLLHPRWKIQRTLPITFDDLSQGSADLRRPENLEQKVV